MSVFRLGLIALLVLGGCDRKVAGGRADGKAVFGEACARCHGETGKPTAGMMAAGIRDLTDPAVTERLTAASVAEQVRHGSPSKGMPSFAGQLTEPQIEAVAAYVLTLKAE